MDEEKVRKRCIELTAGWLLDQGLVGLVHSVYRAAYADGLEAAAKMVEMVDGTFPYSATDEERLALHQLLRASEMIRQHAKEMGHE